MPHGTARHGIAQYRKMWHRTTRQSSARHSTAPRRRRMQRAQQCLSTHGTLSRLSRGRTASHGIAWHSAAQHSAAQQCTAACRHSAIRHTSCGTAAQYSTARDSTAGHNAHSMPPVARPRHHAKPHGDKLHAGGLRGAAAVLGERRRRWQTELVGGKRTAGSAQAGGSSLAGQRVISRCWQGLTATYSAAMRQDQRPVGTLCRIPPLGSYIRRRSRENVAVQGDAPIPARLLQRMPLCPRPCLGNP
jgi:hypothetical protein